MGSTGQPCGDGGDKQAPQLTIESVKQMPLLLHRNLNVLTR